jgi:transcriptional regulator with XRE-family HTH domain
MARPSKLTPKPLDFPISPFGERLVSLRKLRGFSQYSLADTMGISRKQISDYERNLSRPNDEMIIRIALTLKVSSDTLLGLKDLNLPEENLSIRITKRMKDIQAIPEPKKRALFKIIDEFIKPN